MSAELAAIVIPARNESDRVARVVEAAQSANPYLVNVENILVVNNGSTDDTAYWAETAGARVWDEPEIGKGHAIKSVEAVARSIGGAAMVTLDADLIGLKGEHVDKLTLPVLNRELVMNIGYLGGRPALSKKLLRFWGGFSGQRAISWDVIESLSEYDTKGSRLEAALNRIPANVGRGREIGRVELGGYAMWGKEKNTQIMLSRPVLPTHVPMGRLCLVC